MKKNICKIIYAEKYITKKPLFHATTIRKNKLTELVPKNIRKRIIK